jgi:dTDP-4-dehydrorhamnose reductase
MRILIFGRHGQLGRELWRLGLPLGEVTALDVEDLDLCDREALRKRIVALHPQIILNAAAYTAVDRAEQEPDLAMKINAEAPGVMAETAKEIKATLVHYSTDFVFDGDKGSPYTESDIPNPLSAYGRSKLAGEQAVLAAGGTALILRTAWLYSLHGDNFVTKVLQWSRKQETLRVVTDQVGSPTWTTLLAQATLLALRSAGAHPTEVLREKGGIYHVAGAGSATRFEWAQAVLATDPRKEEQLCKQLEPALSAEFPTPAARPRFSVLDSTKFEQAFDLVMPPWEETVRISSLMVG